MTSHQNSSENLADTSNQREEIVAIATEIRELLNTVGEPPQHKIKSGQAMAALTSAVERGDLQLLKSYQRSFAEGLGMSAGHFIHPELEVRGFNNIHEYMVPWRHNLRINLLAAMKKNDHAMIHNRLSWAATNCIVFAYTADTEEEGIFISSVIKDRGIADVEQLREVLALMITHTPSVSEGVL